MSVIPMRYLLMSAMLALYNPAASSGGRTGEALPPNDPCRITDDTTDPMRCANLLARDWKDGDVDSRAEALVNFVTRLPRHAQVHNVFRKAYWACRFGGKEAKKFPVTLTVPQAIANFPLRQGTGTREVVSAVFLANSDENCREARYHHRALNKKTDEEWERVAQFTTIESDPSDLPAANKTKIGTWRSYAISRMESSVGRFRYRFDGELAKGKVYLCQRDAGHTGDVAYISCEEYESLNQAVARRQLGGITTMEEAMQRFKAGDSTVHDKIRKNREVSDSPAWMRCGDLGCCAMY